MGRSCFWCGYGDSNPNASLHENLNLACLPIPSYPQLLFQFTTSCADTQEKIDVISGISRRKKTGHTKKGGKVVY